MHTVVVDASGLGKVVGVDGADPTALLQVLRSKPESHVLLLAPWYGAARARAQAHVAIAADPGLRVCVLPLAHHPFTLTLLGAAVLRLEGAASGWSDPGQAVQLVNQAAARSRSVVWHPRAAGLHEPVPSLAQLVRGVFRAPGFFAEVGVSAGLTAGRSGFRTHPDEVVWTGSDAAPLLRTQLAGVSHQMSSVTVSGPRPYATRGSVELTGLVEPRWAPVGSSLCPTCSVSVQASGCAFCGTGNRSGWAGTTQRAGSPPPTTTTRAGHGSDQESEAA